MINRESEAEIEAEFGLLTEADAGSLMGSRSSSPANLAHQARQQGRLVAFHRGNVVVYPGFQFDQDDEPLAVISDRRRLAEEAEYSETGVIYWLCIRTTYLPGGGRPVDYIHSDPTLVLNTARATWCIEW